MRLCGDLHGASLLRTDVRMLEELERISCLAEPARGGITPHHAQPGGEAGLSVASFQAELIEGSAVAVSALHSLASRSEQATRAVAPVAVVAS